MNIIDRLKFLKSYTFLVKMVNLYFSSQELRPSLPRKPKAFGFTDLNTGAYYQIQNNGKIVSFIYDSPACLIPSGFSSKEDYLRLAHKGAIIITGHYDPIYIQELVDFARVPMRVGTLIIDENSQMLCPDRYLSEVGPEPNIVVKRKLEDGTVVLLQNKSYRSSNHIDAFSLSVESSSYGQIEDVADLRNPRLGLEQMLEGNVLIGDGDELLLNLKYSTKDNMGRGALLRGIDVKTGMPVMSPISRLDLIRMGKDPERFGAIRDNELGQMILLDLSRAGGEKFFWQPDALSREHNQLRYWLANFGLEEVLWRKTINLEPYQLHDRPMEREMARFDESGNFVGLRLQVKYLY